MKKIISILTLICFNFVFSQSNDEKEIYSLIINEYPSSKIIIKDSSQFIFSEVTDEEFYGTIKKKFTYLQSGTINNLKKQNSSRKVINTEKILSNVIFFDKEIIFTDDNWTEKGAKVFAEKYGEKQKLFSFSNVAFNYDHSQAFLQYSGYYTNDEFSIIFSLFKKKNGKWALEQKEKFRNVFKY